MKTFIHKSANQRISKLTNLLIMMLISASIFAQAPQKMSYQAVVRDASGTLVANTAVGMQISILQGSAGGNAVYVETQTPTTNANGLVSLEIGAGTVVSGDFTTINWANGSYFIKTETDPTGGTNYTITGTSQLLSVPYALSAGNVTGLEKITEGSTTGWRLIGRDPANYGNIGSNATDLSLSGGVASTTNGATGNFSLATGFGTEASGSDSTAMGLFTVASGNISTAMGNNTTASGAYSTAMGDHTGAHGVYSTAMGHGVGAFSYASTALGRYNVAGGSQTTWIATDPLFEIGNGADVSNKSNALTVLKNGTITAPSLTNALINTAGSKALITKEYADANLKSSGLEKITEGANTGWRLIGRDPANYGNIGSNATDLSFSNSASTTRGATGNFSTAMGSNIIASGFSSTAMGANSRAFGSSSTAMGDGAIAFGFSSASIGFNTLAGATSSTAIGRFNIGAGNATSWIATDPLFEIGNGSLGATSNALTVLKNGNTDVSGVLRASGKTWPTTGAGVEIAYDKDAVAGFGKGFIQSFGRNTAEWKPLEIGALTLTIRAGSVFPITDNFTDLGVVDSRWKVVYAANGTIQTSDRRMKKDIKDLNYGLHTVLQLRPVSYKWKKGNQDVNLGLIAQEVQKLIPEMVDVGTDKDQTLGMNYSELIPVLIKAVQEQQKIIETQQNLMASQQEVNVQQQEVTASQQTEIDELKGLVSKLLKKNNLLVKN